MSNVVCAACVGASGEQMLLSKLFAGITFLVTHIDQLSSSVTHSTQYRGINCVFIL